MRVASKRQADTPIQIISITFRPNRYDVSVVSVGSKSESDCAQAFSQSTQEQGFEFSWKRRNIDVGNLFWKQLLMTRKMTAYYSMAYVERFAAGNEFRFTGNHVIESSG